MAVKAKAAEKKVRGSKKKKKKADKSAGGVSTSTDSLRTVHDEVDASIEAFFENSEPAPEAEQPVPGKGHSLGKRMARLRAKREAAGEATGGSISAEVLEESEDADRETPRDELRGFAKFKAWRNERAQARELEGQFESYPHLLAIKPREGYVFHSDYYKVDDSVACILAFFHRDAADDRFGSFWGVDRMPAILPNGVTAIFFEQARRMDENWVKANEKTAERLDTLESNEQAEAGTRSTKQKASKISQDMEIVSSELRNGASYLSVQNRLMLKAPDLETLDEAIEQIERMFIERFGTLSLAAYAGEQRTELGSLFKANDKKRGYGFYFTSTEFAGSYSMVTNGINDKGGEFVGEMVGDLNNSAVLFEVNGFDHHTVIADAALNSRLNRQRVSNLWCSKISQAAMLDNRRVVHMILDGAEMDQLGPKFQRLTSRVDMASGDVNMFEMFGDKEDELAIFSVQMEKIKLMFEQFYDGVDGSVQAVIRGELERTLTDFYIENRMWQHNAQKNRSKLRVVGIKHEQVPLLQMFVTYLNVARDSLLIKDAKDPDQLRAYNVLLSIAETMLSSNGELFNRHTSTAIDGVNDAQRVIYNFSALVRRGKGLAMAQFVNVLGFAVASLKDGDLLILHGVEHLDPGVKKFVDTQLGHLYDRGGRVVYSYDSVEKMLEDQSFNTFDAADYTILGPMREPTVDDYEKRLHQELPQDLRQLVTRRDAGLNFIRRAKQNVVFHTDLALGINPEREAQRRELIREAAAEMAAKRQAEQEAAFKATGARTSGLAQAELADAELDAARAEEIRHRGAGKRMRQNGAKASPAGSPRREKQLPASRSRSAVGSGASGR